MLAINAHICAGDSSCDSVLSDLAPLLGELQLEVLPSDLELLNLIQEYLGFTRCEVLAHGLENRVDGIGNSGFEVARVDASREVVSLQCLVGGVLHRLLKKQHSNSSSSSSSSVKQGKGEREKEKRRCRQLCIEDMMMSNQ